MSFAEKLREARKERGISQEDLAELLNVSRQAVSKWEQGTGYPEVEKMIMLSKKLSISLDYLLNEELEQTKTDDKSNSHQTLRNSISSSERIIIKSQDGKSIISCYKVFSVHLCKNKNGRCDVPQYALFGVDQNTILGEHRNLLGWYADQNSISKEIDAITVALNNGESCYELKHTAKVKRGFLSVKLDE